MREAGIDAPALAEPVRGEERDGDGDDRGERRLEADGEAGDDRRRGAGLRRLRDLLHRTPRAGGVVLGDEDERDACQDADDPGAREPVPAAPLVEHHVGHEDHAERREGRGDVVADVQRAHRVAGLAPAHHEDTDDARDEAEATHDEREEDPRDVVGHREDRDAEDHRADVLGGGGLEQVRATTGAVADVVTDEVGDDGRVPRVVLRDARLDLPDEVRTDVSRLRIDAAAELREQRDERRAEPEADDRERRLLRVREAAVGDEHDEHADERKSDDEDAGDRAAAERDAQRVGDAVLRGRRRAEVRLHRDEHTDDPGGHRAGRAHEEGDAGLDRELLPRHAGRLLEEVDDQRNDHGATQREERDSAVLALDECDRAFVDRAGDFLHRGGAGVRAENVVCEVGGHRDGDQTGDRDDPKERVGGKGVQARASSH